MIGSTYQRDLQVRVADLGELTPAVLEAVGRSTLLQREGYPQCIHNIHVLATVGHVHRAGAVGRDGRSHCGIDGGVIQGA